jgi:hypothetical protein
VVQSLSRRFRRLDRSMYTHVSERDRPRKRALEVLKGRRYIWEDPVRDDGPAMAAAAILLQRGGLFLEGEDMAVAANGAEAAYLDHRRRSLEGRKIPSLRRDFPRSDPLAGSEENRRLHEREGWRCYLCTRPTLWVLALKGFDSRSETVKLYAPMACDVLPREQRLCVRRGTDCRSGNHHAPAGFTAATREHVHPLRDRVRSSCWTCQQQKLSRDPVHLARVPTWERLMHQSTDIPLMPWDGELR